MVAPRTPRQMKNPPLNSAFAGCGVLAGHRLALVSNRGPVEFALVGKDQLEARRGSGGVVSALAAMAQGSTITWFACPMTNGDRLAASRPSEERAVPGTERKSPDFRFVDVTQEAYDRYYNVFANPLLWFLQHYMWGIAAAPNINAAIYDAWENGYTVVNRAFAETIANELAEETTRPVILFQDYHLYLAPGFVRKLLPAAFLQHFIHIPWPAPRYWGLLPEVMRTPILSSLCQNDIVGLQTHRDVHNFLYTCEYLLPRCKVNYQRGTVRWKRTTYVRSYPVSIDVAAVSETAVSSEAEGYLEKLLPLRGERTIVRVDRLEPSKNIVRGFSAFDTLLSRYPDLAGKVKMWAFLVPSRLELALYQEYQEEVFALVTQINQRHGNDAWRPIEVFHENNYVQAIAALTQYDVLLVNSVIDGMNLVAKEGVSVNQRNGVLVLSETAGAWEQLGRYALTVAATDVEGTVQALHSALTMSAPERRRRARQLRQAVAREDLADWTRDQFADIATLLGTGKLSARRALAR
ncbi:MAG: trehalose-6-phosphate synthase [Chloroflexi bacterium]|nr:trehalose-6-phosphate synthase [Chloroflexota bacterium]